MEKFIKKINPRRIPVVEHRYCLYSCCGKELVQRPGEKYADFRNRKTCGKSCAVRHRAELKRAASPPKVKRIKNRFRNTEATFWSRVDKIGDCWEWKGRKNENGYGMFCYHGKDWRAHRLAYFFVNKKMPPNLHACHKCDNPSCVNPDHIFWGTAKDNMVDCAKKRRTTLGEKNHHAKLTKEDVLAIRSAYKYGAISGPCLAKKYNVSRSHICGILNRKFWKHL